MMCHEQNVKWATPQNVLRKFESDQCLANFWIVQVLALTLLVVFSTLLIECWYILKLLKLDKNLLLCQGKERATRGEEVKSLLSGATQAKNANCVYMWLSNILLLIDVTFVAQFTVNLVTLSRPGSLLEGWPLIYFCTISCLQIKDYVFQYSMHWAVIHAFCSLLCAIKLF